MRVSVPRPRDLRLSAPRGPRTYDAAEHSTCPRHQSPELQIARPRPSAGINLRISGEVNFCFGQTEVVIIHVQAAFAVELLDASPVETLKRQCPRILAG